MSPESPARRLVAALHQYAEELEAIKVSLEGSMMLFTYITMEKEREMKEFAQKYGTEVEDTEELLRFNIPPSKISDYRRLNSQLMSMRSAHRLMPRNLLVALVCTYDAFLGKLIRFILEVQPSILDLSERQLSFSELQNFESIDAAREFIIEKEIETVLRKSHIDHFKWLEKKLETPFNKGLESWPNFVELTERRNLFVHTDGKVSSQYLKVCGDHKCNIDQGTVIGTTLGMPSGYFDNCYNCLYEIGIKLAHVVWRNLLKDDLVNIDTNLNDMSLSLIEKGNYQISIKVLEFFTQNQMKHKSDASKRIMVINLAQAYKWNGQDEACLKLLDKHDWSSSMGKFSLAVAVLKDDWDVAFEYMKKLKHDSDFDKVFYKSWPLFKRLRKHEKFPEIYQECYNEHFESREELLTSENPSDKMPGKNGT
ncbi:hypothetical protein WJU23_18680 [Prosthecobacter sp. SYSU 5D2]|uniref:hypothetical protein n=1 Tax=Prosthecobacter sp. SYSU 5D2 TaxID=3134134 RepID=UPI0031FF346F